VVTDSALLEVYAQYHNEMGYATHMVDLARHMQSVDIY
jgi:glyceraldehyde-3-phosphate dehydrogenase/erythrose-4-phosphate dehydrogenase